jgi:hypothetical protein
MRCIADACGEPPLRSFWYRTLVRRAGTRPVHDWLVEQANLRGFYGAFGPSEVVGAHDPSLSLEEVVVALVAPLAPVDGRTFKLVVRILQSGRVDARRLHWLARRERADRLLHWLLELVPREERNDALEAVAAPFAMPPRAYRAPSIVYDARRLVRRVAGRGDLWRTRPS